MKAKKLSLSDARKALTAEEIEAEYGIPKGHLANKRSSRTGPAFYRVGRRIYYRRDEFERWFFANKVLTSDSLPGKEE